jgi:hypothetical protein
VRGAREAHELVERLLGGRILLDGLGPPLEGGHLVDELLLGDLGQSAQQVWRSAGSVTRESCTS